MLTKKCIVCGKKFTKAVNCSQINWENRKYCSKKCSDTKTLFGNKKYTPWLKGTKGMIKPNSGSFKKGDKLSEETKAKMKGRIPWNKGKKDYLSEEALNKIKKAREKQVMPKGKYHQSWVGNKIKYSGLHRWIRNEKGHARKCEHCGLKGQYIYNKKDDGKKWNIEWANIDHLYKRDVNDYVGLCKKCHSAFDTKINKF